MPAERASMDEPLILGRYRLLERLASGGSADVWRAHDEQLGRHVAVKRLHPHLVPDQASRKRLAAEARAAAGLSHPGIVEIYDVDATGESPALVMELVDGESLAARIARAGALQPHEAATVAADVADALFHAHRLGVIHRDVKPGNVLLSDDGRTRLVDFGIAHSLALAAERLTLTGTVVGTLHAMAPEQLTGGPITPRTDLYGLGVVLHEALTGRPPYAATSPVALADAQRAGPPPLDGIDPALAAIVASCLAYDPSARPLHAGALADALRAWLGGDASAALAIGGVAAAPAVVDTAAVTEPIPAVAPARPAVRAVPPSAPTPPASASRWWPAVAVLALAALVVAALAAFVSADPGTADRDASPTPLASPSASPSATPEPPWLAGLVRAVERDCGPEVAADYEAEVAGLDEEAARDVAEDLRDECDGGGRGKGKGNGNGNGRGNGHGRGGD
jgi:tRNA A-37 threonylcarbamoyl transferase component Bud32